MTMGPRGTYTNVGLPGSGLSYRSRVVAPQERAQTPTAPAQLNNPGGAISPQIVEVPSDFQEIRSADVSVLTSPGLNALKQLINEAEVRRRSVATEVRSNERTLFKALTNLKFTRLFIVRICKRGSEPRLVERCQSAAQALDESRAQFNGCFVEVDFSLDATTLASYAELTRAFDALRTSQMIWDITATRFTNRVVERTAATQTVRRVHVRFDYVKSSIVKSDHEAMRLNNASGRAVQIFPGYVMMIEPRGDFALIEYGEFNMRFSSTQFIEREHVPRDSEVIGQTWTKANKDGSPDKRFKNNRRIPIVRYGEILMSSPNGLLEAYEFSNYSTSEAFATAFRKHREALSNLITDQEGRQPISVEEDGAGPSEQAALDQTATSRFAREGEPNLIYDWAALCVLIATLIFAAFWAIAHR